MVDLALGTSLGYYALLGAIQYLSTSTITLRPEGRGGNFNVAYDLGDKNDSDWRKWRSRLDNSIKSDSYCLDVPLGNAPYTINAIEAIEDYRDLIILYISSGRMARDTCRGLVRYKGPARIVILALENLYPNRLSYILDCGLIDRFRGLDSLCPLYRCYSRSVTFLARYLEYKSYNVIRNPIRGRRRGPDPYRNSRVKFARRSHTLKVKAYKLAKFCDTDIYVVVNHQRGLLEHFRLLEDLYRDIDLANVVINKEAL
ncbi:hypothetical protein N7524_006416 [Penicillium chrysogenum]|nr:hypothetical protein N7524_006416 [Penicillium chrysogenum]